MYNIWLNGSSSQSVTLRQEASASPGNLLEMQISKQYPRPTGSETGDRVLQFVFQLACQVILIKGKAWEGTTALRDWEGWERRLINRHIYHPNNHWFKIFETQKRKRCWENSGCLWIAHVTSRSITVSGWNYMLLQPHLWNWHEKTYYKIICILFPPEKNNHLPLEQ